MVSTEELMNVVWNNALGMSPRAADVSVVQVLVESTQQSLDRIDVIADLLWDHWMGEPEDPSLETVTKYIREVETALDTTEPPGSSSGGSSS